MMVGGYIYGNPTEHTSSARYYHTSYGIPESYSGLLFVIITPR